MHVKKLVTQLLRSAGVRGWQARGIEATQPSERFPTTSEFLGEHAKAFIAIPLSQSLDLGCGGIPRNPFQAATSYGVDINSYDKANVIACDLSNSAIPLEAATFDYITAFDFIEHIPRVALMDGQTKLPFINLMNDIHRVLKPGGLFFSQTPAYPCKEAFQDPTHVNIITEDTFPLYFCNDSWARAYGFKGSFKCVAQEWCRPSLLTLLQKTSD
jgi:SAM-dependent methyltransferase